MRYTLAKVVRDVRVAMDRNRKGSDLLPLDANTLLLDESVGRCVEDASRMMLAQAAPVNLGRGVSFRDADVRFMDQGCGQVALPADFLRLVSFRMDDWTRAVSALGSEGDTSYSRQRSPIKALRGTAERPCAFLLERPGGPVLEFYSCDGDGAKIAEASYVPIPRIYMETVERDDEDDLEVACINLPWRCYGACVAMAASIVCGERGATEMAKALEQEAQALAAS